MASGVKDRDVWEPQAYDTHPWVIGPERVGCKLDVRVLLRAHEDDAPGEPVEWLVGAVDGGGLPARILQVEAVTVIRDRADTGHVAAR